MISELIVIKNAFPFPSKADSHLQECPHSSWWRMTAWCLPMSLHEPPEPTLLFGYFALHSAQSPQVFPLSKEELWILTLPAFLSIIILGASSIRLNGFNNYLANSIQSSWGDGSFVPSWAQHEDYFHSPILASEWTYFCKTYQKIPVYSFGLCFLGGLHAIVNKPNVASSFGTVSTRNTDWKEFIEKHDFMIITHGLYKQWTKGLWCHL